MFYFFIIFVVTQNIVTKWQVRLPRIVFEDSVRNAQETRSVLFVKTSQTQK